MPAANRLSFLSSLLKTRRRFREVRHLLSATPVGVGPKVSVMVITYNHGKYIRQALESILRQERDFDLEINVIDDASTDDTQRIALEYQERYPGVVNCLFNESNVGHIATQLNTYRGFQSLRGQYFALLEGDDYWSDQTKLRKQVAFLDANPSYVACAHNTLKVYDDGSRPPEHFLPFKKFGRNRATIADLISMSGVYHLSSVLYRNVFGQSPPACFSDPFSCEVTINMVYGQFGDFHHIDEYMSVYRVHGSGLFSTRTQEGIWLFHLYGYRRFALYLGPRYWFYFLRAFCGFGTYVLLAHRRGVGPKLHPRTKLSFAAHLVFVVPSYLLLRAVRTVVRSVSNAADVLGHRGQRPAERSFFSRWLNSRKRFREVRAMPCAQAATEVPKVSIVLIARNDGRYVRDALESVLMQQLDFDIEVDVVDDCSTDSTREIVLDYQARFPGTIRTFFRAPDAGQQGVHASVYSALHQIRGRYFALLGGDDYWTDALKLKKQLAFLEANPSYVACAHSTLKVHEDDPGRGAEHFLPFQEFGRARATIRDVISMAAVYHPSSVLYRNVFASKPPPCLADRYSCEVTMNMVFGQYGDFHHIDEHMSVHRVCASGSAIGESRKESTETRIQRQETQFHASEGEWIFHLHGFTRFSMYLGPRYWLYFSRAVCGFTHYVLAAHRNGTQGRLRGKTVAMFAAHFLLAAPLYLSLRVTHALAAQLAGAIIGAARLLGRALRWSLDGVAGNALIRVQNSCDGIRQILARRDLTVGPKTYQTLAALVPFRHQFIRCVIWVEDRIPTLTGLRLRWKYGKQPSPLSSERARATSDNS